MSNEMNAAATPKTEDDVLLKIDDLTVYFELEEETVKAVNGVSLSLKRGTTLGMVGETGAGKTTTALAALNLIPSPPGVIKSGSLNLCGYDVLNLPPRELDKIRGKEISMIFQDPMTSLNPVFTVGQQIAETIKLHESVGDHEAYEKAKQMLEMVGIRRERAGEYPHQFSGGMKQRVMIAIALACNPQVLIADEPTTALDVTIQAQVMDMMRQIRDQLGTAVLLITHDLGVIAEMCDEVAVMYAGRIVEFGTLAEVFNDTKHPYTEGLFNSLPNIQNRDVRLKPIPGLMPDPTNLPEGCPFAPRCQYAKPDCIDTPQKPKYFSDTHYCVCCAYDDPEFRIERSVANG